MATAAVEIPSSNYLVPGSHPLAQVAYPKTISSLPDAETVAAEWVASFNELLRTGDRSRLGELFLKDSYWRDLLCLTWDFHTLHGPEKIAALTRKQAKAWRINTVDIDKSSEAGKPKVSAFDLEGKLKGILSFLTVETDVGRGRGVVRLLQDAEDQGKWKIFTLFTALQELKGHEELNRERRPTGQEFGELSERKNWKEKRLAEQNFEGDLEPDVLIVDKLAEWFELYANALELNVWCKTELKDSKWDDTNRKWTVMLERDNGKLHPRYVIQATGISGEANFPAHIDGLDSFKGDGLIHSSQFSGVEQDGKGKKAVIVGCSNSAHDIAQDYYEHGYEVTMVQRSSTLVVKSQTLIDVTMKGLYSEDGPPVEDADLIQNSIPNAVMKRLQVDATREMTRRDAPLLRGLAAAGFSVDSGPDGSGLWMKYLHRGGGYYIDIGASQLVADGKIKVKQGQEIMRVNAHSISFANGDELEADEIIFATGYGNMRQTARKIFGDALADRVADVWGFDEEGETRTIWRRTGHPGFWFFGGNLAQCRYYSRILALQIKALDVGAMEYDDI
ncbi:MAG: hypothetical protein Q9163_002405 [Psora crenata]